MRDIAVAKRRRRPAYFILIASVARSWKDFAAGFGFLTSFANSLRRNYDIRIFGLQQVLSHVDYIIAVHLPVASSVLRLDNALWTRKRESVAQ